MNVLSNMYISSNKGQMTVELAVVLPVVIVCALIGYNVIRFAQVCAIFDRASRNAIVNFGVAPSGNQDTSTACQQIQRAVEHSLNSNSCQIDVEAHTLLDDSQVQSTGLNFICSPLLTKYTITLHFYPWPSFAAIAGVKSGIPAHVTHKAHLVVDRFRPGVIV